MRTVAEHQALIASLLAPTRPVALPLEDAVGRVLAADLVAPRPLPAFDNSAMDGYAVRAADVAGASTANPVRLPVAADVPAGRVDGPSLAAGTAHRIMTGAPMPLGADTVVQVEATDGGTTDVEIREPRGFDHHVRHAGEDVAPGETVLAAGTVLGAAQLGLLAALGEPVVAVLAPLRVLVLSTGSELVTAGEPLAHGQIHESNGIMLATAVRAAGASATQLHFVPDDVEAFLAVLGAHLADVDLVITSGGVSAGAYEVVKDALADRGVEFVKVAMQPGMPQGAGRLTGFGDAGAGGAPGDGGGVAVVTLPGNPVSALVSFEVFLRPALRAAMGYADLARPRIGARLTEPLRSPGGKRQFRRGVVDRAQATVTPIGPPASHFLRWLAVSDCLLDVAEDVTELTVGDEVEVWLLD